ncbi:MAG TPA: SMI1/KNR4 family protein, partial [Kofleriaceae bacterium]|nr:SMI1/KNR4 family protein [Kofleriaceae bacterium]
REHRGGTEVKELVDLLLSRWDDFGERRFGFHAQEFLRNALSAIGVDRDRIARLEAKVPATASAELLFNLACAHAVARDKVAMLRAVNAALEAGAMPAQFRRDADFLPYQQDPDFALRLARADVPQIPVDVEPYVQTVRTALDSLVGTLREYGEQVELRPPVRLDAILDAERAHKISLPNDYRALLTITNGMRLWEHEFFGAGDYREATPLAARAARWIETTTASGATGLAECVPVACWGQPNDWLLYDPRGRIRGGEPGYVLMLDSDDHALEDLAAALGHLEDIAREVLGTN